jgi:hypothetical protein
MTWLLILTLSAEGQTAQLPAGVMADERLCIMAGAGVTAILEEANPGLVASWSCTPLKAGGLA